MRWRRRHFLSDEGFACYFGAYPGYEEALASLPASPGFGEEALTEEFVTVRTRTVFAYDYPVLWWLAKAFDKECVGGGCEVLDIGGSVGVHFYAYQQFIELPPGLRWTVAEVPTVARVGERLALQRQAGPLAFTTDLDDAVAHGDADIWMAAGSLQYLPHPSIPQLLRRCSRRPRHILLNKLPLTGGDAFVTTQNIGGHCFVPVHVFNRNEFIDGIVAEGLRLKDEWAVHERTLTVPGYPERSLPSFTGLYFAQA